jgi:phosphatidylglycerophosphate synthase
VGSPPPGAESDRTNDAGVFTVPNLITMVRLLCLPVFVWLVFGAKEQTAAAILLAVLGATDWVDGYVARRFHQVSTVGKVLDPTADRLLVVTAVIVILVHGAVPVWFGVTTIVREALVGLMVLLLASLGAARIDVARPDPGVRLGGRHRRSDPGLGGRSVVREAGPSRPCCGPRRPPGSG